MAEGEAWLLGSYLGFVHRPLRVWQVGRGNRGGQKWGQEGCIGLAKTTFMFFRKMLQENPDELLGQPSICVEVFPKVEHYLYISMLYISMLLYVCMYVHVSIYVYKYVVYKYVCYLSPKY